MCVFTKWIKKCQNVDSFLTIFFYYKKLLSDFKSNKLKEMFVFATDLWEKIPNPVPASPWYWREKDDLRRVGLPSHLVQQQVIRHAGLRWHSHIQHLGSHISLVKSVWFFIVKTWKKNSNIEGVT